LKKLILLVLILVSGLALAEGAKIKPGLWQIKAIRQVMDGRDMTAQMATAQEKMSQAMANMSPEQRQRMEAMTGGKGMPAQHAAGGGARVCFSAAMAARDTPVVDPKGRCERTTLNRNGNTTEFEFKCSMNGHTSAGKGKRTVNGDTVLTSVDVTMTDARGKHTMQSESQMTYLGADCQGIKPLDELAKEAQAAGH